MLKIPPANAYPPEPGRYLRGNDLSPVAVAVILLYNQEEIPPEIEGLVRIGVETGAALSGTIPPGGVVLLSGKAHQLSRLRAL
jgi:hypothetical protein